MAVFDGRDFNQSFIVDQGRIDIELFIIVLQKLLKGIDFETDTDNAKNEPVGIPDFAIDENGNAVVCRFVIIDIERIFFIVSEKIVIPDIFGMALIKRPVKPAEMIVMTCLGRNEKNGIVIVFLAICIQIRLHLGNVGPVGGLFYFLGQEAFQQVIVGHRQRDADGAGKNRFYLGVDAFRRQCRYMFDILFEDANIGPVADNGGNEKANQNNRTDQDIGF